jgi:hypothetical protein
LEALAAILKPSGLAIFVYFNPARWNRVISFWTNDLWGKDGVYQTKQALLGIAMRGKVKPLIGIRPIFIAILTLICMANHEQMP